MLVTTGRSTVSRRISRRPDCLRTVPPSAPCGCRRVRTAGTAAATTRKLTAASASGGLLPHRPGGRPPPGGPGGLPRTKPVCRRAPARAKRAGGWAGEIAEHERGLHERTRRDKAVGRDRVRHECSGRRPDQGPRGREECGERERLGGPVYGGEPESAGRLCQRRADDDGPAVD